MGREHSAACRGHHKLAVGEGKTILVLVGMVAHSLRLVLEGAGLGMRTLSRLSCEELIVKEVV